MSALTHCLNASTVYDECLPSFKGEVSKAFDNPLVLVFSLTEKGAVITSKNGVSNLKPLSNRAFLETSPNGTSILWTFVTGSKGKQLVKQIVFEMGGVMAFTTVFTCE